MIADALIALRAARGLNQHENAMQIAPRDPWLRQLLARWRRDEGDFEATDVCP